MDVDNKDAMLKLMKASAGSGKTYSLARQYISLLLKSSDRYAYRHILAVTFTNKATDEMKSRILKELHIMASNPLKSDYHDYFIPSMFPSEDELQKKARTVLQDILHDYSAFAVSTIDRFFQHTLKAFSREIGHFASYQVELDKDSLVAESVDRILDSLTEDDGGLLTWLTRNVLEQIEKGGRYSLDANLLDMAKRLKSPQRQEAIELAEIDPDDLCSKEKLLEIREKCREIQENFRSKVKSAARAALNVLEGAGVNPQDSNRKFLCNLYAYDELTGNDKLVAPKDTFIQKALDSELWFAKSKSQKLLPLVYPFLEAPLEDFCSLWNKEYSVYNTACILDEQLYGLGVAAELTRTFDDLMKEKNVLCIDDSNVLLKNIIDGAEAPFVYEKIGVRYDHYLLDEFQDTSSVQWQNFRPLLQNSESQGGENLIVGDVKQSIYRWRGSDWKLLDETIPSEFKGHEETVLDTNYRSLSNVIKFNNEFFKIAARVLDVMDGFLKASEIYDEENEEGKEGQQKKDKKELSPMVRIYSDVEQKVAKKGKPGGNVRLTFCDKDSELDEVLRGIEKAVEAGARLSEIAVLVRSNLSGESVANYLIENGISVVTDDSLKVKNALTVRRLVSLMSYMDNPQDTVASYLAGMLDVNLPRGCASLMDIAEELYRGICKGDKDEIWKGELLHIQSFMDCLQEYVSVNGNSLRGFLKFWQEKDPSISSPSSGDSVRIMTIHKSKGLDFPYVIIPFAENITLYKADSYWCSPQLKDTELEGVAEGVYDVSLSKASRDTLFAEYYEKENFLQHVDNINTIYVAMTRAALGMHIIAKMPPAKCLEAISDKQLPEFKDFSQILYWFAATDTLFSDMTSGVEDGVVWFEKGQMVDFNALRKEDELEAEDFPIVSGQEFPSIPLNQVASEDEEIDIRERGRLKFSADSLDFFKDDQAGVSSSNRIRGIVLHDILAQVKLPDDIPSAVDHARMNGLLTSDEAQAALEQLTEAVGSVADRNWFPQTPDALYNEASLIDVDGSVYRPDRVVVMDGEVKVIDYKFGEHHRRYERQVRRYMDMWRRMGYENVSGYLWYLDSGNIVELR